MGEPQDGGEQTAMLREQEACDQGDEHGEAEDNRVGEGERVVSAGSDDEQRDPGEDENELGRHADGRVDHHGRCGVHGRDTPLTDEPHAGEVAADSGDRQERIDRLAYPADPEDRRHARPAHGEYQRAPGERAE